MSDWIICCPNCHNSIAKFSEFFNGNIEIRKVDSRTNVKFIDENNIYISCKCYFEITINLNIKELQDKSKPLYVIMTFIGEKINIEKEKLDKKLLSCLS